MIFFSYINRLPDGYFDDVNWNFVIVAWCIIFILFINLIRKSRHTEPYSRVKTKVFGKEFNYFDNLLNLYFPYYQSLQLDLQKKFVRRLEVFLELKQFIPRKTEKNEVLNILIAACATQLTFGLDSFYLFSFDKILIYPDAYFSEIRKQYHKGEINIKGNLIVLSANHFLEGIKDYNDGINLGLHEIAHAVNVNEFEDENHEFIQYFKEWEVYAKAEMPKIKADNNHFMRNYAATNIHEMFAVSTEYFFEMPEEFSKHLPNLFKKLCQVYKQNPLNKEMPLLKF